MASSSLPDDKDDGTSSSNHSTKLSPGENIPGMFYCIDDKRPIRVGDPVFYDDDVWIVGYINPNLRIPSIKVVSRGYPSKAKYPTNDKLVPVIGEEEWMEMLKGRYYTKINDLSFRVMVEEAINKSFTPDDLPIGTPLEVEYKNDIFYIA